MNLERTAAYVLAVAGVFQTLLPSWTIKPHCWRSIDIQIGRLHMLTWDGADSDSRPLLHRWQKEPKRLKVCINDSDCIMASLDEASHAWTISKDESETSTYGD